MSEASPSTRNRGERSFYIRTYGCQMNVHDSEKVANLLLHNGWSHASDEATADMLLINTCSIRDKAEHRLYSDLGALREWKAGRASRVLGVGGCVAQQEGDTLLRRFDQLDFAFGTHNLRWVPELADAACEGSRESRMETHADLERFDFPERHPDFSEATPGRAFVTVMEGCDMFCSFCVVPHTRGREISRGWRGILDEVKSLARAGVSEVTLLGQTVNAYGRHDLRRGKAEAQGTRPFAELLQEIDAVPGIRRIRYTSPHPIFFDDALIDAHRSLESLCPHVHLPAQSGSDRILERMRRRYDAERLLGIVSALREARPDVAITTDLIVGFPGEDDDDFEATLSLVRDAGFVDSFSFKYSPRPGTPAPHDRDQVPGDRAQSRLEALQSRQREQTLAYHRSRVGSRTHALVTGPSRRGGDQWQGRDPHNRVVNFLAPENVVRVGDLVEVCIEEATPHSLIGEITPEALKDPQQRAEEGTLV